MQVTPAAGGGNADLALLAKRLASHGAFTSTPHLLRGVLNAERGENTEAVELTVFRDGRAVFKGVSDAVAARRLYSRYVGD